MISLIRVNMEISAAGRKRYPDDLTVSTVAFAYGLPPVTTSKALDELPNKPTLRQCFQTFSAFFNQI